MSACDKVLFLLFLLQLKHQTIGLEIRLPIPGVGGNLIDGVLNVLDEPTKQLLPGVDGDIEFPRSSTIIVSDKLATISLVGNLGSITIPSKSTVLIPASSINVPVEGIGSIELPGQSTVIIPAASSNINLALSGINDDIQISGESTVIIPAASTTMHLSVMSADVNISSQSAVIISAAPPKILLPGGDNYVSLTSNSSVTIPGVSTTIHSGADTQVTLLQSV